MSFLGGTVSCSLIQDDHVTPHDVGNVTFHTKISRSTVKDRTLLDTLSATSAADTALGPLRQHLTECRIILAFVDMVDSHMSIYCQSNLIQWQLMAK